MLANRFFKQIELGFWRLIVGGLKISRPITGILQKQKDVFGTAALQKRTFADHFSRAITAWLIGIVIGYWLFS